MTRARILCLLVALASSCAAAKDAVAYDEEVLMLRAEEEIADAMLLDKFAGAPANKNTPIAPVAGPRDTSSYIRKEAEMVKGLANARLQWHARQLQVTPTRTRSVSPTVTPSVTAVSMTRSVSPSVSVSASVAASRSVVATPSVSRSRTPSLTRSSSISPSFTSSTSATPSVTPSNSATPSVTPTSSLTPSVSATATPSATPSVSASPSISPSVTSSATASSSTTPSVTPSPSVSSSNGATPSLTPSVSESPSISPTVTGSSSQTATLTATLTGSVSASVTASPTVYGFVSPSRSPPPPSASATRTPNPTPSRSPSQFVAALTSLLSNTTPDSGNSGADGSTATSQLLGVTLSFPIPAARVLTNNATFGATPAICAFLGQVATRMQGTATFTPVLAATVNFASGAQTAATTGSVVYSADVAGPSCAWSANASSLSTVSTSSGGSGGSAVSLTSAGACATCNATLSIFTLFRYSTSAQSYVGNDFVPVLTSADIQTTISASQMIVAEFSTAAMYNTSTPLTSAFLALLPAISLSASATIVTPAATTFRSTATSAGALGVSVPAAAATNTSPSPPASMSIAGPVAGAVAGFLVVLAVAYITVFSLSMVRLNMIRDQQKAEYEEEKKRKEEAANAIRLTSKAPETKKSSNDIFFEISDETLKRRKKKVDPTYVTHESTDAQLRGLALSMTNRWFMCTPTKTVTLKPPKAKVDTSAPSFAENPLSRKSSAAPGAMAATNENPLSRKSSMAPGATAPGVKFADPKGSKATETIELSNPLRNKKAFEPAAQV